MAKKPEQEAEMEPTAVAPEMAAEDGAQHEATAETVEVKAEPAKPEITDLAKGDEKPKADKKASEKKARVADIMLRFKTDTVYENSKGEFFTSENLALLSVGNDKTKVETHKK